MNIAPEQLDADGYSLVETLDHEQLIPFVQTYIRKLNASSVCYYVANILAVIVTAGLFGVGLAKGKIALASGVAHFAMGFGFVLLLLPVHELLHALAYRLLGAKNTSFDMNLKKFYFMALADKFVANRLELAIVALTPFAVISLTLTGLAFITPIDWAITIFATLILHTSMCCGDFGMLSFFEFHQGKKIVTYDDVHRRKTYFFAKSRS